MKTDEASKIYSCLFKSRIPRILEDRFNSAAQLIEAGFSPGEVSLSQKLVAEVRDLESLEYAARITGKLPLLCKKFAVMVLLAETQPQNYSIFINEKNRLFQGWGLLFLAPLVSLWKLVKGYLILFFKAGDK